MKNYRYAVYEEGKLIGKYKTIADVVKNCIYTKEDHQIWYDSGGKNYIQIVLMNQKCFTSEKCFVGTAKRIKYLKHAGIKRFFWGGMIIIIFPMLKDLELSL